jgi:predicted nucleotidyltransferase
MSKLTKVETIKAWAKDMSKSKSKEDFFFWIIGSVADGKWKDSKDFDVAFSGLENYKKIKAVFKDAYKYAKKYKLPLDMVYWSVPPVGIPKDFKVRKYRNGHKGNGAIWAECDLKNPTFENIKYGISRISTIKGFDFRSDKNVMKASSFLQDMICG